MAEINFHEIMEYFLEKAISVLFSLTLLISRGGVSHAKRNASGMVSVIIEVFWDRERPNHYGLIEKEIMLLLKI